MFPVCSVTYLPNLYPSAFPNIATIKIARANGRI